MTHAAVQSRGFPVAIAMMVTATLVVVMQGIAQSDLRAPSLFKPLPQKRAEPVRIKSSTLEWNEKARVAIFSGDVHAVQGETDLRASSLIVFYEDQSSPSSSKNKAADGGQIRRMEASGPVRITQKAQCAVGDRADFDMRTNTATLSGNVVARRSHDVVRGDRMVIDLSTGLTRMEGRQVDAMFNVNSKSAPGGC